MVLIRVPYYITYRQLEYYAFLYGFRRIDKSGNQMHVQVTRVPHIKKRS